jgi:hypothetical protein
MTDTPKAPQQEQAAPVRVSPSTLAVTHIYDGEEVVTGGHDGQVYIATFACEKAAAAFVSLARKHLFNVTGIRRASPQQEAKCL